jgi:gas vesicle protein
MAKNNHDKGKGLAVGAAIGAVAGVVTGILFAPKSGKETRKDISDAAHKAKVRVEKEAKNAHGELNKVIEKAEIFAKDKSAVVTVKAKEALESAKKAKADLMAKANDMRDGATSDEKELEKAVKKAEEAQKALAKALKK